MSYSILDCTLRDGGYYTNWDFSEDLYLEYLQVLSGLAVDVVELGYLSPELPGYQGRFGYLPRQTLAQTRQILRKDQKLAIMLNAKECAPQDISKIMRPGRGLVDVVRLAVAPSQQSHGLALARALHAEGFEVAFNMMYLSKYVHDLKVLEPLVAAGDVLQTVSLVDSYGGCMPEDVGMAITAAKNLLPQKVGFHGHDNIMLAFANARAAIKAGADIVDSTLLGMGRGAGNLRTELILAYQAAEAGKHVNFAGMAHLLDRFGEMQREFGWGANLPYIVSGFADLPQKDVMDWLAKKRYSISAIVGALQNEGAGLVDNHDFPELAKTAHANNCRTVVVVGGGPSLNEHAGSIMELVDLLGCSVIHSSTRNLIAFKNSNATQFVCLPGHDVQKIDLSELNNVAACIVPVPPRFVGAIPEDEKVRYSILQANPYKSASQANTLGPMSDVGPLALAMGTALSLGVQQILLVGFDGYPHATLAQQELMREVQSLLNDFRLQFPNIQISSITPTDYQVKVRSLYGIISGLRAEDQPSPGLLQAELGA